MEGKEKSGEGVVQGVAVGEAGEGPFAFASSGLRLARDNLSSPVSTLFHAHNHAALLYLITVLSQYQQPINQSSFVTWVMTSQLALWPFSGVTAYHLTIDI